MLFSVLYDCHMYICVMWTVDQEIKDFTGTVGTFLVLSFSKMFLTMQLINKNNHIFQYMIILS